MVNGKQSHCFMVKSQPLSPMYWVILLYGYRLHEGYTGIGNNQVIRQLAHATLYKYFYQNVRIIIR